MHNWGHAKASLYLKNDVTGEILDSYKIEKVADIYATTRFVKNVALS